VARILIVGCGCRGQALARELLVAGHAVRGTTRDRRRLPDIEAAGADPFVGDPDRVGTLVPALAGVTVMCLLLGSATGSPEQLQALHSTRLDMLLQRAIDTTIRGILYEASGTVPEPTLTTGAALVQTKCDYNGIHHRILQAKPDHWLAQAVQGVNDLITTA
jgi:uncharacterized protein YbjT (DUF2867 family)